ncbi:hypothetical protein TBLA_0F02410 [Henningerozyma blattae CBS 6284]|uniref:precorrin-2 dehydrogenase n=1 Tax=Henningerozyma blattae (strain ATCC 34711 / CBS 6284 / DSM 70876 / NBRC 10599 / NRRL Y-10934 / UCD 77-7) TaxID=1071380 RepID=I2H5X9_HENB6|nr:hypothetical protein TBLA_0F02410 [Tetrapisispora blattae CBS 6284]CCH61781.1 hypothetical protein TBLA_0F02410 [Tetrapisispora blattae CBS 6284]
MSAAPPSPPPHVSAQSLPLAHRLAGKKVLLIGAGSVAHTRLLKLIPTGARVTLISDRVSPAVQRDFLDKGLVARHVAEPWDRAKAAARDPMRGYHLVLITLPRSNQQLSRDIYAFYKCHHGEQQLVNVADEPGLCDFYFGADLVLACEKTPQHAITLSVCSGGGAPRFAALLRDYIQAVLDPMQSTLLAGFAQLSSLRAAIRALPSPESARDIGHRMRWVRHVTDALGLARASRLDVARAVGLYRDTEIGEKQLPGEEEIARLLT